MTTALNQVPLPAEPRCLPEEIFRAHQKGEITEREFQVGLSVWAADNAWKYRANPYPPLAGGLISYCENRVSGRQAYDEELSRRLGYWVQLVVKLREENQAALETLAWAKERVTDVGMNLKADSLQREIGGHELNPLPREMRIALQAQRLDAEGRKP